MLELEARTNIELILEKASLDQTGQRFLDNKGVRFSILAIAAGLIILGLGLSLQAGGGTLNHSGDLAYLQVEAEGAEAIEYVVLKQPGVACDASAFADGGITVDDGQIGVEIVEDIATVGLCIRADYGYGNYLYEKYDDDLSFIFLILEEQPDDSDAATAPAFGLRVSIGSGVLGENASIPAEYVVLTHRSIACDAAAFTNGGSTAVIHNQLIDLNYDDPGLVGDGLGAQILCFRADYGFGNYVYEMSGISANIFFNEELTDQPLTGEQAGGVILDDLTALAPMAESLQYVVFSYPGKSCQANSFNIDADFITFSLSGYPELIIEAEILASAEALCFRADYGDGRYAYQKYGGRKIEIRPHYKLTLSSEKVGGQLRISSNTDVVRWRLARNEYGGYFYGSTGGFVNRCGSNVAFSKSPLDLFESSDSGNKTWVIDLPEQDYGLQYCIEAQDGQGSIAYLGTAPIVSDLRIEIVQEGSILKAAINQPEQAESWQAVKTSGACSHFSFAFHAKVKKELSFELTSKDHNRSYCFRVKDKYGGYVFQVSLLVNMAVQPEIQSVLQVGDVLLAEVGDSSSRQLFFQLKNWRVAKVDQPICSEDAIQGGITPSEDLQASIAQLISLGADDVGYYFCFAVDYRGGFSHYRLSEQVTAFENWPSGDGLRVGISQRGDFMIARASQNVDWYTFLVQDQADCSQAGLPQFGGGGGPEPEPSRHDYVWLYRKQNGAYYCFRARSAAAEVLYTASPVIENVERENLNVQINYPYETPETIDSGQDFADFLRPYLTDEGLEILDGLDGIFLHSPDDFADICGLAGGCYGGGRIHLKALEDYNNLSFSNKQAIFNRRLSTFIHEFMHATDYQDPDTRGFSRQAWRCLPTQFSQLTGLENEIFRQYTQCLEDSHPLFRQLRDLYDDLPPDSEFGCSYRYLTNINGRWGGGNLYGGSYQRHMTRWYTELYAESVLIRDLPLELENHYSQYFKNRSEIFELPTSC